MRLILILCLLPIMAQAESATVARTLDSVILPSFAEFARSTKALSDAAQADCRASSVSLKAEYNSVFDAWVSVEAYRFGPLETNGQGLSIAFWPDTKSAIPKALRMLLSEPIPQGEAFANMSVAARGLFAMEAMLYDPDFNRYSASDPSCKLTQAIAIDLAQTANAVNTQWQGDFAGLMRTAGGQGNTRFLSSDEVVQQFYTAILAELEFISDVRIGRPLGDTRPRPNRAEARASARSLRNVKLSLSAVTKLATVLAGVDKSDMFGVLDYAVLSAERIKDPTFGDVVTPLGLFRLQELQKSVRDARAAVEVDLGMRLGVGVGFNALDGD